MRFLAIPKPRNRVRRERSLVEKRFNWRRQRYILRGMTKLNFFRRDKKKAYKLLWSKFTVMHNDICREIRLTPFFYRTLQTAFVIWADQKWVWKVAAHLRSVSSTIAGKHVAMANSHCLRSVTKHLQLRTAVMLRRRQQSWRLTQQVTQPTTANPISQKQSFLWEQRNIHGTFHCVIRQQFPPLETGRPS